MTRHCHCRVQFLDAAGLYTRPNAPSTSQWQSQCSLSVAEQVLIRNAPHPTQKCSSFDEGMRTLQLWKRYSQFLTHSLQEITKCGLVNTSSAGTVLHLSVPEGILHWATQDSAMTAVGGTNLQISVHRLHFNKLPLNTCYLSCFIWAIFKEVKPYWHQRGVLNFSLSF